MMSSMEKERQQLVREIEELQLVREIEEHARQPPASESDLCGQSKQLMDLAAGQLGFFVAYHTTCLHVHMYKRHTC